MKRPEWSASSAAMLPAFPVARSQGRANDGISLRDYFAAQAMPFAGALILERAKVTASVRDDEVENLAKCAYEFADAMLLEREK